MHCHRLGPWKTGRVATLVAVAVLAFAYAGCGSSSPPVGGDPCAIVNGEGPVSPQVCEEQKKIDQQHEHENASDNAAGEAAENAAAARGESASAAGKAGEAAENATAEAREKAEGE